MAEDKPRAEPPPPTDPPAAGDYTPPVVLPPDDDTVTYPIPWPDYTPPVTGEDTRTAKSKESKG